MVIGKEVTSQLARWFWPSYISTLRCSFTVYIMLMVGIGCSEINDMQASSQLGCQHTSQMPFVHAQIWTEFMGVNTLGQKKTCMQSFVMDGMSQYYFKARHHLLHLIMLFAKKTELYLEKSTSLICILLFFIFWSSCTFPDENLTNSKQDVERCMLLSFHFARFSLHLFIIY